VTFVPVQVWVMDFIENFSCFQEFALQQDHFGHDQVTIFVVLCFRHRRAGEEVWLSFAICFCYHNEMFGRWRWRHSNSLRM